MTPRENYRIYLSIAFDLEPWNPLIHNLVSERYGDSDFDPFSVVFSSFGDSVSTLPPSPWITPVIDGFTITNGDVPCFLVDSRCSNQKSAFDVSEENQKHRFLIRS
jgi:hypothetical protein